MGIETTRVTSESLQASIRTLLPSQVGFGDDLHATNLITPVIDLTPSSEGSSLPVDMARALSFQSQTSYQVQNASNTVIANTAGFWRVVGILPTADTGKSININLFDGTTSKIIIESAIAAPSAGAQEDNTDTLDLIIFLASGESIRATNTSANVLLNVTVRQIADSTGTISNPTGFTSE